MKENKLEYLLDFAGVFLPEQKIKLYIMREGREAEGSKIAYTGTIKGLFDFVDKYGDIGCYSTNVKIMDCLVSEDKTTIYMLGKEMNSNEEVR